MCVLSVISLEQWEFTSITEKKMTRIVYELRYVQFHELIHLRLGIPQDDVLLFFQNFCKTIVELVTSKYLRCASHFKGIL